MGDIEGVRKNARLKRLAMQVEIVADMEKKLPMFILRCVDKHSLTNRPNDACSTIKNVSVATVQNSHLLCNTGMLSICK